MVVNKFKYIKFKDYVTSFGDYFDYLEEIKSTLPSDMADFFCNEDRYKLHNNITLHDAWIENINISNQYTDNEKLTNVEISFLLANHIDRISLTYKNVSDILYEGQPSKWVDKAVDLLTHEINIDSQGCYEHIMEFDSDIWIILKFKEFSYNYY